MRQKALRAEEKGIRQVNADLETDSFADWAEDTDFAEESSEAEASTEMKKEEPFAAERAATLKQAEKRKEVLAALDGMKFGYLEGFDNLSVGPIQQRKLIQLQMRMKRRERRRQKELNAVALSPSDESSVLSDGNLFLVEGYDDRVVQSMA